MQCFISVVSAVPVASWETFLTPGKGSPSGRFNFHFGVLFLCVVGQTVSWPHPRHLDPAVRLGARAGDPPHVGREDHHHQPRRRARVHHSERHHVC